MTRRIAKMHTLGSYLSSPESDSSKHILSQPRVVKKASGHPPDPLQTIQGSRQWFKTQQGWSQPFRDLSNTTNRDDIVHLGRANTSLVELMDWAAGILAAASVSQVTLRHKACPISPRPRAVTAGGSNRREECHLPF